MTVNVPTILEQKLFGTPVTREIKLSHAELKTLFHVGRKLELTASLMGPTSQPRTVKAHRSYGYDMEKPDGKVSRLDFECGQKIVGLQDMNGNGFHSVKIVTTDGEVAAQYRLL